MFSSIIDDNENHSSLIDNESETEILNESFAQEKKLEMITLKKQNRVRLVLDNDSSSQILKKAAIIDLKIEDHQKELFCYLTKIENYTLILKDDWLQKHNSRIDWKNRIMRFSKECVKTECLDRKTTIEAFESKKFEDQIVYESSIETLANNDETKLSNETLVSDDLELEKRNEKNTTKDSNKNSIQFFNSRRFLKLLTWHNHQMYCLYFKNKFERKLDRH